MPSWIFRDREVLFFAFHDRNHRLLIVSCVSLHAHSFRGNGIELHNLSTATGWPQLRVAHTAPVNYRMVREYEMKTRAKNDQSLFTAGVN